MKEKLGAQKPYMLKVEPVEFPNAAEAIAKVRESRGVIADVEPEPVVVDEGGDSEVAGEREIVGVRADQYIFDDPAS